MRIIIAGSRDFTDYKFLKKNCSRILSDLEKNGTKREDIEIISGTARGADRLGERFAAQYGIKVRRFPADWDRFGKRAGFIRNREMAEYASEDNGILVAFWDGRSRGTSSMIDLAKQAGLHTHIIMAHCDISASPQNFR